MKIDTGKVELTTHAFSQMQERFPDIAKNKNSATNHVRSLLKSSNYIGVIPDKDGNDSHMYVHNHDIATHIVRQNCC